MLRLNLVKSFALFSGGAMFVISCGGGSTVDAGPVDGEECDPPDDSGLFVDAGRDGNVDGSGRILLSGNAISTNGTGFILQRGWTQVSGSPVEIVDANMETAYVMANDVAVGETLVFEYSVDDGVETRTDRVSWDILPEFVSPSCEATVTGSSESLSYNILAHYTQSESLIPDALFTINENSESTLVFSTHCDSPVPVISISAGVFSDSGVSFSSVGVNESQLNLRVNNLEQDYTFEAVVTVKYANGELQTYTFNGLALNVE